MDKPVEIDLPGRFSWARLAVSSSVEPTVRQYCDRGLYAVQRGDLESARKHFDFALEFVDDFPDLWLFRAGVAETAEEQSEFLEHVLAYDPHNPLAIEAKAKLDGTFDEMMAEPDDDLSEGEAAGKRIRCPQCNGILQLEEDARQITCQHCGYVMRDISEQFGAEAGARSMVLGMMKRQNRPTDWNIGERWLRCTGCSARTTFNRDALSSACPFCGTRSIVQETTTNRFEQPDLIVPFKLQEDKARIKAAKALEQLKPGAIKRLFSGPAPKMIQLDVRGVYLPFWLFDATAIAKVRERYQDDYGNIQVRIVERTLAFNDVPFFAADHLPTKMVHKIEPFPLAMGVDYDPYMLAEYPAEIYDVDVDRAGIEVRDRFQKKARQQYRQTQSIATQGMSYRLGLLPVYILWAGYDDGSYRRGVMNGQTSRMVFGKRRE